jgi:hypothetical protein
MMLWLKNTDGQPDAALTMAFLAFLAVLFKVVLNGASVIIGGNTYGAGTIDAGLVGALLTPTLGAYVFRRYTDVKFDAVQSVDPKFTEGTRMTQTTKTEVRVSDAPPREMP